MLFLTDINECVEMPEVCDTNAFCANLFGSYNCTCQTGYSGNGSVCTSKLASHKGMI